MAAENVQPIKNPRKKPYLGPTKLRAIAHSNLVQSDSRSPVETPDPVTWRPSENEWYPRLHIGTHWQDPSIPIYIYFLNLHDTTTLLFALHRLGDPLQGKPKHIHFANYIHEVISELHSLTPALKTQLEGKLPGLLEERYKSQGRFEEGARVYLDDVGTHRFMREMEERRRKRGGSVGIKEEVVEVESREENEVVVKVEKREGGEIEGGDVTRIKTELIEGRDLDHDMGMGNAGAEEVKVKEEVKVIDLTGD